MINRNDTILILGDTGDVGSRAKAIITACGFNNITPAHHLDGSRKINLLDRKEIISSFACFDPDIVVFAARHTRDDKQYNQDICNHLMHLNVIQACIFAQPKQCIFIDAEDAFLVKEVYSRMIESANLDIENKCKFDEIRITRLHTTFLTY